MLQKFVESQKKFLIFSDYTVTFSSPTLITFVMLSQNLTHFLKNFLYETFWHFFLITYHIFLSYFWYFCPVFPILTYFSNLAIFWFFDFEQIKILGKRDKIDKSWTGKCDSKKVLLKLLLICELKIFVGSFLLLRTSISIFKP